MAPGTTIAEPVAADHKPDLGSSLYEISEYLEKQQAYDLFDYMLRDLLTSQPKDPLQHLIDCLESKVPSGPLQVFVSSAPGVGRTDLCRRLATNYGLTYISAGNLLRDQGVKTENLAGFVDDQTATDIVLEAVLQAKKSMQGFVLDGFPRTRAQAHQLKEKSVVPTHVLLLKGSKEAILERQAQIESGELQGERVPLEVLEAKLAEYTCHNIAALGSYAGKTKVVDALLPPEVVYAQMEQTVRMLPRSKGPARAPRIVILGPRGSGAREHASRLASRLGAVFVDAVSLQAHARSNADGRLASRAGTVSGYISSSQMSFNGIKTSIDSPDLESSSKQDLLGVVGVRLRQPDCKKQGYVMCGFLYEQEVASTLAQDPYLCPTRVVALDASVDVCVARLRHLAIDPVTGKVWTVRPRNEILRSRLQQNPEDTPAAVTESHKEHSENIQQVLQTLGSDGRCTVVQADREPEEVFSDVVEFVERPLPLPASS